MFDGQLSVGILTSFLVYTVQIAGCLAIISSLYGDFMQVSAAVSPSSLLVSPSSLLVSTHCLML